MISSHLEVNSQTFEHRDWWGRVSSKLQVWPPFLDFSAPLEGCHTKGLPGVRADINMVILVTSVASSGGDTRKEGGGLGGRVDPQTEDSLHL